MQRVNLLNKGHIDAAKADEHATSEDFRKLFTEDMTGLYLLSLLLTANHEKAEQCFVAGVEDTVKGNPVFKEWAHSWAKRTIVNNAIKIMSPHPNRASGTFAGMPPEVGGGLQRTQDHQATIASVLAIVISEEHTSELQSLTNLVCRLLLEKKNKISGQKARASRALKESKEADVRGTTG